MFFGTSGKYNFFLPHFHQLNSWFSHYAATKEKKMKEKKINEKNTFFSYLPTQPKNKG